MPDLPSSTDAALAALRRDYQLAGLLEQDVAADALQQFERWFQEALAAGVLEPNAMALATVGNDGAPTVRNVLLKGFDARGLVFFTNCESRKARHLAARPQAALLFTWLALERQVEICGRVSPVTREETEAYFRTRPLASQVGAWASPQSTVLAARAELEQRTAKLTAEYAGRPIPTPPHWGGYRVVPATIEFWQGRTSRLHDRLRYTRQPDNTWKIERLAP